jgi:hypothetical protein
MDIDSLLRGNWRLIWWRAGMKMNVAVQREEARLSKVHLQDCQG